MVSPSGTPLWGSPLPSFPLCFPLILFSPLSSPYPPQQEPKGKTLVMARKNIAKQLQTRTMAWDLNSPNVAIGGLNMPSLPCTALLQFPEVSSLHTELFAESLHLQYIGSIRLHYCAHAARKLLITVPISVVKLSGPDGIFAHLSMFCIWRAWVSRVPMLSQIWCIRKSVTVRVVLEKWNVCTCSLKLYCTWAEYF